VIVDGSEAARALTELDAITRRLRRECPWDREQDERSIVPHTVEEAYELADAAERGDDAKLLDERGAGDLTQVAEHVTKKLIRRHPHIFGETEVRDAADVLRNWDTIKRDEPGREPGVFGEVPENLPALLHARKLQRRTASTGFDVVDAGGALQAARDQIDRLEAAGTQEESFAALGDLLFSVVNAARKLKVDPELALRSASGRFRERVTAAGELAASEGGSWDDLPPEQQLAYYARAGLSQGDRHRT